MTKCEIGTNYQTHTATNSPSTKSSAAAGTFDSFQKELLNWEIRTKDKVEKEQENDGDGNIQMSEKQWHNLMQKVDSAVDTIKDNVKAEVQESKKQAEEKNEKR